MSENLMYKPLGEGRLSPKLKTLCHKIKPLISPLQTHVTENKQQLRK